MLFDLDEFHNSSKITHWWSWFVSKENEENKYEESKAKQIWGWGDEYGKRKLDPEKGKTDPRRN